MLSRRAFCRAGAAGIFVVSRSAEAQERFGVQNCATEWSYDSGKPYGDPFNEVDLDVVFTTPTGEEHRVPGFWAGSSAWRVRYAPPVAGKYSYRTVCSDTSNSDLHNRTGSLLVEPYTGINPLYRHGPLRVAQDKRHLEHVDGTPFFWLGDTWWMGLCKRLTWPNGFQTLTADRSQKGFNVVQIVAGLYPDMEPYDSRGANEAGFPWERDYARINPAYFDAADVRIEHLADHGLVACIVGSWGYFLPQMGLHKMKQHWRYLIARWGAYPSIWCLAGEGTMPFYLSKTRERDAETQKHGWTEIARYVKATDSLRRPVTIHPSHSARECVDDASVVDIDMLQTGHDDRRSIPNTIDSVTGSLRSSPKMPGTRRGSHVTKASRRQAARRCSGSCSGHASSAEPAATRTARTAFGKSIRWKNPTGFRPMATPGVGRHGRSHSSCPVRHKSA